MAKLTTTDISTFINDSSAASTYNANLAAIEAAMEKTLSRDGTSPNTMTADLDMNSQDILNVGTISVQDLELDGTSVAAQVAAAEAAATAAQLAETNAETAETNAETAEAAAEAAQAAAELAASSVELPTAVADTMLIRDAGNTVYVASTASAVRTFLNLIIGTTVQAYSATLTSLASATANGISLVTAANYSAMLTLLSLTTVAKYDAAQTWTANQRKALTSDNDGAFDLSAGPDFTCTPTGGVTISFTNQASGYKGTILFNNTTAYAIAKGANIYAPDAFTTDLSTTGRRKVGYESDGTDVWITYSELLT